MKPLYFVTGNADKFAEAKTLLPQLERVSFDLPEVQSLDPEFVVAKKLEVALMRHEGPLIVEDTSLYLEGLNGFPGPLIKWMLAAVGNQGIYDLCAGIKDRRAVARTVIGYHDGNSVQFFAGETTGIIVPPVGNDGFGWDQIFQPDGLSETFAEMGDELKADFSMRTRAFEELRRALNA